MCVRVCGHLVLKRPSGKIRIFKPDLCTLQKKGISCWEMSTCPNQSATLKPDKCSASHMRRPHKAKWNVATQFIVILRHEKLLHYVKMSWKCRYETLKHSFASSEKAFRFDTLFVFCNVCFLQVGEWLIWGCVCLSSVEYDFRQQERRFLEVLNRSTAHLSQPLTFSLLQNVVIKNLTKTKLKSKKLCKTLFKWLPRKTHKV